MRKKKAPGHNKTVERMHKITRLSYKESRARLKASGWDLYKALRYYKLVPSIETLAREIIEMLSPAIDFLIETTIDFTKCITDYFTNNFKEV